MRAIRTVLTLVFFCLALIPTAALAAEQVDLLLVLAVDVSRSVDTRKFQLQREGYAVRALQSARARCHPVGPQRPHRRNLYRVVWRRQPEGRDRLDVDRWRRGGEDVWRPPAGSAAFVRRSDLDQRRHRVRDGELALAPYESTRRTIDVSGDGTNNAGRDVTAFRDEAVSRGITINGLAILSEIRLPWNPDHTNPPGGLERLLPQQRHRRAWRVRHGGEKFNSFGEAIINKMIAEVSQAHEPMPPPPGGVEPLSRCVSGSNTAGDKSLRPIH